MVTLVASKRQNGLADIDTAAHERLRVNRTVIGGRHGRCCVVTQILLFNRTQQWCVLLISLVLECEILQEIGLLLACVRV